MQLSESMRLLDWFAHSVNLFGWPSLVFLRRKGATPVAQMAPRFALDVAIWATNMSPLLRVGAPKSVCLCRGEIHGFA